MADLQSLIESHINRSAAARQRISSMNHAARMAAVTGDWSQLEAEIDGRIRDIAGKTGDGPQSGTGGGGSGEPASNPAV